MSGFEKDINEIGRWAFLQYAYERNGGLYSLVTFSNGSQVSIDLIGENIDNLQVEPDQVITGYLTNNRLAEIAVEANSGEQHLEGHIIGLGVHTDMATPGGILNNVTLRHCTAPGRGFAYTLPGIEGAEYTHVASCYGRLIVDDVTVFDRMPR